MGRGKKRVRGKQDMVRKVTGRVMILALAVFTLSLGTPTWAWGGVRHFHFDRHGGARSHFGSGHGFHNHRFDHFYSRKFHFRE